MPESRASARRVAVAMRRGRALQMRADGLSYDDIHKAMPYDPMDPHAGYKTRSALIQDIQRALMQVVAEPAAELRALEANRLDMLRRRVMEVINAEHVVVSHGKVIYLRSDGDLGYEGEFGDDAVGGKPLTDHGPVLAAVDRLLKIGESMRKLFNLDLAQSVVKVMSDDSLDEEIKRLTAELNRAAAEQAGDLEGAEEA